MQWILYGVIVFVILCVCIVVYKARYFWSFESLNIGTFLILAATLIVVAIYTYDTNRMARLNEERWKRERILRPIYQMAVTDHKGENGKTGFVIVNPSDEMLQAKVWCDLKVYGVSVFPSDAFNGKSVWTILPAQRYEGWFEIEPLLKQRGTNGKKMISEYSDENRDKQLTLDLKIEFHNESGERRVLPSMKYYFVFNEWRWVPAFTEKADWSF